MNKPTDEELEAMYWKPPTVEMAQRALHDAGIAHGWRECIEALLELSRSGSESAEWCANYLERIAKERGHG